MILFIQTLELLSCPSTANIEIVALSFRALEFWAYFYKHWNSHLIVPNILSFKTLGFSPYFYKHWNSYLILSNMEFWPISVLIGVMIYLTKHWNFRPIFILTGILTSSFETLKSWPYCYKHSNCYLVLPLQTFKF